MAGEEKKDIKGPKKIFISCIKPWKIIRKKPLNFFLYCLFTVFAGQIGIIINIILRVSKDNTTITQSLYLDSINGAFYTFSIALIASALGPLFINFIEKSPTEFRSIKITTISITIFVLFFAGIFYSGSVNSTGAELISNISIDWAQLSFLILSILIALYVFNILELDNYREEFEELNDENYAQKEDEEIRKMEEEVSSLKRDSRGNRI